MTVFLERPGAGFPGRITYTANTIVETALFDPAALPPELPIAYGVAVKFVYNGSVSYLQAFQFGDTVAQIVGILASTYPTSSQNLDASFADNTPNPVRNQNLITQGYVNVLCTVGVPERNQPVYIRTVENLPALVGDFETIEVFGETAKIPDYVWAVDGKDSENNTQIRLKV